MGNRPSAVTNPYEVVPLVPDIKLAEIEQILPVTSDFINNLTTPRLIEEYNIGTKDFLEKSVVLSLFTGVDNYKHLGAKPMPWKPETVLVEGGNSK
eukprot:Pgem_evm1s15015